EGGDSGFSVRARRYLDLDAATGVDSGLQRFGRVGSQLAKTLFGGRRFWALRPELILDYASHSSNKILAAQPWRGWGAFLFWPPGGLKQANQCPALFES